MYILSAAGTDRHGDAEIGIAEVSTAASAFQEESNYVTRAALRCRCVSLQEQMGCRDVIGDTVCFSECESLSSTRTVLKVRCQ